jgi:hypothetical protein
MQNPIITEGTLTPPTLCGSDEDISIATQSWSSIINALSYMTNGLGYYGPNSAGISLENKKAIYQSLICFLNVKMDEMNNVTAAPAVTTMNVNPAAVPVAPAETEIDFSSYAESKAPIKESISPIVRRMRELAGIPHAENRV